VKAHAPAPPCHVAGASPREQIAPGRCTPLPGHRPRWRSPQVRRAAAFSEAVWVLGA
jgi:hypothetical protein